MSETANIDYIIYSFQDLFTTYIVRPYSQDASKKVYYLMYKLQRNVVLY